MKKLALIIIATLAFAGCEKEPQPQPYTTTTLSWGKGNGNGRGSEHANPNARGRGILGNGRPSGQPTITIGVGIEPIEDAEQGHNGSIEGFTDGGTINI